MCILLTFTQSLELDLKCIVLDDEVRLEYLQLLVKDLEGNLWIVKEDLQNDQEKVFAHENFLPIKDFVNIHKKFCSDNATVFSVIFEKEKIV